MLREMLICAFAACAVRLRSSTMSLYHQTDHAALLLRALRTAATEKATGISAKVSGGE